MNNLRWFARMLFSPKDKLSEQDNLDWNWWLYIELPYWWNNLHIIQAFQQCVNRTLAHVRRKNESSDDELPF